MYKDIIKLIISISNLSTLLRECGANIDSKWRENPDIVNDMKEYIKHMERDLNNLKNKIGEQ